MSDEGLAPEYEFRIKDEKDHQLPLTKFLGYLGKTDNNNDKAKSQTNATGQGEDDSESDGFPTTDRANIVSALNAIFARQANFKTFTDRVKNPQTVKSAVRIGSKKIFHLGDTPKKVLGPWNMPDPDTGLQARVGFYLGTRTAKGSDGKLLLNLNTTTSAFYPEVTVEKYFKDLSKELRISLAKPDIAAINNRLHKVRVVTTYMAGVGKTERFYAVGKKGFQFDVRNPAQALGASGRQFTEATSGKEISIYEYFRREYPAAGVQKDDIVVELQGSKGPIHVPAKLLKVSPGQIYARKTDMVEFAVRSPQKNKDLIEKHGMPLFGFIREEDQTPEIKIEGFDGLAIKSSMLQVTVKVLHEPIIEYAARGDPKKKPAPVGTDRLKEGKWNLADKSFISTASKVGSGWTFLEVTTATKRTPDESLRDFFVNVDKALKSYGIGSDGHVSAEIGRHQLEWDGVDTSTFSNDFRTRVGQLTSDMQPKRLKLLFVLLAAKSIPLYAMIKSVCEQKLGVHTICHVCIPGTTDKRGKTIRPYGPTNNPQTLGNLAMKFNLKMSTTSVNQKLEGLRSSRVLKNGQGIGGTMLMGIDVTHAGAGALIGAPSIAAVVGSTNDAYSQFPAILRENPCAEPTEDDKPGRPNEEVMDLEQMARASIGHYFDRQGKKPRRLIVFRDGLSEDQLDICKKREIPKIKAALAHYPGDTSLLVICAVKRHHVRFFDDPTMTADQRKDLFPTQEIKKKGQETQRRQLVNPAPGTLVDAGITRSDSDSLSDFFLISHDVLSDAGTAQRHEIASMTHSLCYLFGRSTTSVRLAPPAYYADLAADRARCYARNVYAPDDPERWYKAGDLDLELHKDVRGTMFYI